ncbi:hypothetical protein [Dactylosporangium sp. NPDC048998]|uniref:hypothetical protein n=1 Tax=Dactylosporangium sp. NPDC048998 TaxID=3363976 RepID=UPI0037210FCE
MTDLSPVSPARADLEAARLLLDRLGVSPADLLGAGRDHRPAPTFAEYVPVVAAAVSDGSRRAYCSYWNRVVEHWADRRLDEPSPSDIERLAQHVKANVVARRNGRGGRSAAELLIAALRCLYKHAVADGHVTAAGPEGRQTTPAAQHPAGESESVRSHPSSRDGRYRPRDHARRCRPARDTAATTMADDRTLSASRT